MKKIFKILGIILLIIIVGIGAMAGFVYYKLKSVKDTHDLEARTEKLCDKFMADKNAPGLCVAIMKGDTLVIKSYGYANKDLKTAVDSNTIFEIGSITKVFTSEMTELLAEKGVLNWNDNILQYLPADAKLPVDDHTTLTNLATHTAGFLSVPDTLYNVIKNECDPYSDLNEQMIKAYLRNNKDKKQPDTGNYLYSNFGAGLLGHILVYKTGMSYDSLLQQLIAGPLGMQHTSLTVRDTTKFATGYDDKGKKTCHWNFPVLYGCGAIRSDMADMVKFLRANLDPANSLNASFKKTQRKVTKIPTGGIAYGWHIDKANGALFGIDNIVWHNGGTGGFRTYMAMVPEKRAGVIVFANQSTEEVDALGVKLIIKAATTSFK